MSFVEKWMELEDILLSEISWTQKNKYCIFSLIFGIETKDRKSKPMTAFIIRKIVPFLCFVILR
jgi:hypothetical protein